MKNAFILMWDGSPLTERDASAIGNMLIGQNYCRASEMVAVQLDHEAIAKALAANIAKTTEVNVEAQQSKTDEAVRNAVIFLGVKYGNYLKDRNYIGLALALSDEAFRVKAKRAYNLYSLSAEERSFLNAITVISTIDSVIPKKLATEYHFNQQVVQIIKNVYEKMLQLCATEHVKRLRIRTNQILALVILKPNLISAHVAQW